jgi:hypothetical protein
VSTPPRDRPEIGNQTCNQDAGPQAWENARCVASALIDASGIAEGGTNSRVDFWNAAAADFAAPLLLGRGLGILLVGEQRECGHGAPACGDRTGHQRAGDEQHQVHERVMP